MFCWHVSRKTSFFGPKKGFKIGPKTFPNWVQHGLRRVFDKGLISKLKEEMDESSVGAAGDLRRSCAGVAPEHKQEDFGPAGGGNRERAGGFTRLTSLAKQGVGGFSRHFLVFTLTHR